MWILLLSHHFFAPGEISITEHKKISLATSELWPLHGSHWQPIPRGSCDLRWCIESRCQRTRLQADWCSCPPWWKLRWPFDLAVQSQHWLEPAGRGTHNIIFNSVFQWNITGTYTCMCICHTQSTMLYRLREPGCEADNFMIFFFKETRYKIVEVAKEKARLWKELKIWARKFRKNYSAYNIQTTHSRHE